MKESFIEKISSRGGQLLALVVRNGHRPAAGIEFLGTPDLNQQVGVMSHAAGHVIQRHVHKPVARNIVGTSEVVLVTKGVVEVDIYGDEKELSKTIVLGKGDIIFLVRGGHGFRVLENVTMVVVKQGPYLSTDDDKDRF